MKRSPKGPRVVIIIALLLVALILILGNQSFRATEKATFDEFNQRQLVLARGAATGIELYFETPAEFEAAYWISQASVVPPRLSDQMRP